MHVRGFDFTDINCNGKKKKKKRHLQEPREENPTEPGTNKTITAVPFISDVKIYRYLTDAKHQCFLQRAKEFNHFHCLHLFHSTLLSSPGLFSIFQSLSQGLHSLRCTINMEGKEQEQLNPLCEPAKWRTQHHFCSISPNKKRSSKGLKPTDSRQSQQHSKNQTFSSEALQQESVKASALAASECST